MSTLLGALVTLGLGLLGMIAMAAFLWAWDQARGRWIDDANDQYWRSGHD